MHNKICVCALCKHLCSFIHAVSMCVCMCALVQINLEKKKRSSHFEMILQLVDVLCRKKHLFQILAVFANLGQMQKGTLFNFLGEGFCQKGVLEIILAEGAIALLVTLSGSALFAS